MDPDEARFAALRQFGWRESIKEECHEQRGVRWLEDMARDVRFGARQLRKNPAFTLVAVLTLALGMGANTAIFSVVKSVLLKPLPYGRPDRLVMIWADNPRFNLGFHELPPSQQDIQDWRSQAGSFEQIAGISSSFQDLSGRGDSKRVGGVSVTASFFPALGVRPALGRVFTAEDEQPGKDKVAVISHELWMNEFGGDPNVVGGLVTLNNVSRVVVGVMPAGFSFPHAAEMPPPYNLPAAAEVWLPVAGAAKFWQDDLNRQFIVIGRWRPGVGVARAQTEVAAISDRAGRERPATHAGWGAHVRPLSLQVSGAVRPALLILLGAVAIVLMIACANVASLLLGRAVSRRKEMAIRSALGAGRARVVRQLLTESLLLALAGGGAGLLLGAGGLRVLLALSPQNIPRLQDSVFDGGVFAYSLAISVLTGVGSGMVPAWNVSTPGPVGAMNAVGRGGTAAGSFRSLGRLVAGEVAVAVVLLVGAALMLQSFGRLMAVDTGFLKTGVRAFDLTFRGARYDSGPSRIAFFQQAGERLKALPNVRAVAAVSNLPLGGSENVGYFVVEGLPKPAPGQEPLAEQRVVTAGYFDAMGARLLQGRDFDGSDGPDTSLHADHVSAVRPIILLLQGGVLTLLLIGGVNLVNLLLVRASNRERELAIRQSLGAGRLRVVAQSMVETALLALTGGVFGLGVAAGGIRLLGALGAQQLPLGAQIAFNGRPAAVALVGTVLLGVLAAMPFRNSH